MNRTRALVGTLFAAATIVTAGAQTVTPVAREVPARTVAPPTTVSPELQKIIGAPLPTGWEAIPNSKEELKSQVAAAAAAAASRLPQMRDAMHVRSEPRTIDGVKVYILTPEVLPPENRNRLIIHVHGGCYVSNPGESGTAEGVMLAGFGHFKVISVDYRMAPDHVFPAALDDAMIVWRAVLKSTDAKNIAIIGSSAGGALTLSMILRAKEENLPMPGAIAPGTPMSDLTNAGDSFQTNAMVDNVLVAAGASCDQRAALYADGHDLRDPLLSPIFGDMHGFPPTILNTGTRDLLLSSTVRVHQKLRQAGVEAALYVHEGMAHAGWNRDFAVPESRETFEEVARFFDLHLGK